MTRTHTTKNMVIVFLFSLIGLSVVAYNIWSYSCGHCTVQTFLSPGIPGILLLLSIVSAIGVYLFVRYRRKVLERRALCSCGEQLEEAWVYCVTCGAGCER